MNIAIFGGSFNPVHLGHYEIVRQTLQLFNMSKVIVVPAYQNPLKNSLPSVPEELRIKMLDLTFKTHKNVEISEFELQKRKISYTYQTLSHYKKQYSNHQLYLIMGEDAFSSFHLWAEADKIIELSNILVFYRPGIEKSKSESLTEVQWIKTIIPDISASEVRQSSIATVKKNCWLHPDAFEVWREHREHIANI